MTTFGLLEIIVFAAMIGLLTRPLGGYLTRVYAGEPIILQSLFGPIEAAIYRCAGIDPKREQSWYQYAISILIFHALGIFALYLLQRAQPILPLNSEHLPAVAPDLALNTAISFVTNTSWQSYGGETTLSYTSQMLGITVQSFLSAASGMAVVIALIRGFARRRADAIGNFWGDLTRGVLYVLLPICIAATLFLVAEGVPQTLSPSVAATTLDGGAQIIARGPVATQEAIKLLSGDGGGFFNANSSHPFENPTPLTNIIELVLIFALGAALTNCFGCMIGSEREGWVLLSVMAVLFGLGVAGLYSLEASGNPVLGALSVDHTTSGLQPVGNMEGKEVRFGIAGSALFAEVSTASSDGAVNAMHDSFLPLSGGILLGNMMVDEVIIGAPGSGLYSMLLFCIVSVFLAGLMIGRTPEYVGKKVGSFEIKMTLLALICVPAATLGLTAMHLWQKLVLLGLRMRGLMASRRFSMRTPLLPRPTAVLSLASTQTPHFII
jgi:K+-transporting ATPase ATPase A chain